MTQHHPEQAPVQDAGSTDAQTPKAAPGMVSSSSRQAILGALFLMATSAIGPGFITQTANFTVQMGAAFAFAILVSILVDIAVQLNVWRVIGVSGLKAQQLGNAVLPGVGWLVAALVAMGGLVFNIGNTAGGGLGLNAMTGLDAKWGGLITAALAIGVFLSRKAGMALDKIVVALGVVMILVTGYVAIVSDPPVGEAMKNMVLPEQISYVVIVTLIGGTIGGYITYAGAHRMVDSGITGPENAKRISSSSVIGIIITGIMRFLLFLAILGVVAGGAELVGNNLAAQAFEQAAGFLQRLMVVTVGFKVTTALQARLLDHLLSLDAGFYQDHSPGSLIERVREFGEGRVRAAHVSRSLSSADGVGSGAASGALVSRGGESVPVSPGGSAYGMFDDRRPAV